MKELRESAHSFWRQCCDGPWVCRLRQGRGGRPGARREKEVREQTVEWDCVEPHGHRKDHAYVLSEAGAAGET